MRIQYASDLHLEFKENSCYISNNPLQVVGDILVLAGDTTVFRGNAWEKHPFFDWCNEHYQETYIIPGNHEYYDGIELTRCFDGFESNIRDNVRYINNRSILIGNTELFFTTLWTRIKPTEIMAVQIGLTDCHRIKFDGRNFTSQDYEYLHSVCMNWLTKAINESKATHKIIVTHHCPTEQFVDPRFGLSNINSAFAISLDNFIENCQCDSWIYGHTHYNGGSGTMIGGTQLLCNQLGYTRHGENLTFNNAAFIEV